MTITILEQPAVAGTATVTFASLPAGNVILVWGQGANASGAAMTMPTTVGNFLTQINPGTVTGLTNQIAVVGTDFVPASAPLTYTIGGTGGAFMTGGFEISGLEATDALRLHDPSIHEVGTLDTATAGSHSTSLVTPGNWTENEGFLFGYLQCNAAITSPQITGATQAFFSTSRLAFYRILGANDKNTHPTVGLSWTNDVRWIAQMFLLRPPAVAPPTAPLSPNLITARNLADNIKTGADNLGPVTYSIEASIDTYEAETGSGTTTTLRARYYEMRRALAELRKMPDQVQTQIDILQGTLTPAAVYKAVYDTTDPFAGAVTDFVDGTSVTGSRWVGIRTIPGAVVNGNVQVSWWVDRAFSQPPSQNSTDTIGPDWSIPLLLTSLANGAHTLGLRVVLVNDDGEQTGVEQHSYTFTSSGGAANTAPTVNAGTDQTVASGTLVTLTATATDAEDVLSNSDAHWTQVSGPATLTPPPPANSPVWSNVAFNTPGTYVLQAIWSDPRGATGTDNKTVTVSAGGGAGNQAKARLGIFARTGYSGDGAGPRPTLTKDATGAVAFVKSYWEPDIGRQLYCFREVFGSKLWSDWRVNLNGYIPKYATLCQSPRTTIANFAIPMFTEEEYTNTFESHRQAYARGAQGAYIQADKWTMLRDLLGSNGYGVDFPVWIDPCSEYDVGQYTSGAQQTGRLNFGRIRDGATCVRRYYEYLKASLPLLEMGTCRISSGGTPKYMTLGNTVETWGGLFPNGQNLAQAMLYELDLQKAPLKSWFGWLAVNQYMNSEGQAQSKIDDVTAACLQYGIQTGSEEWGVSSQTVIADNLAMRDYIDRRVAAFNAMPASGPGSLKFHVYFEGLGPNCMYCNYPNALAHFMSPSVLGT